MIVSGGWSVNSGRETARNGDLSVGDGRPAPTSTRTDPPQPVEPWRSWFHPGEERRSEAHAVGTRDPVLVLSGGLDVRVAGEVRTATTGTAVTDPADVPHTYRSTGEEAAELVLVVSVPR